MDPPVLTIIFLDPQGVQFNCWDQKTHLRVGTNRHDTDDRVDLYTCTVTGRDHTFGDLASLVWSPTNFVHDSSCTGADTYH